ncbi:MAG: FAD-dependent oxidoreductase [Acidobacteria bacterium]|nr:FAD-dependent oxidoreductase [Acidobacteriota bacterium]
MSEVYDLIVIGGGSAGLVAAGGAGILGARVALVEKHLLGGECLYTGCVPSKALIRSARFAHDARRAADFGFRVADFGFAGDRFAAVTNRVQQVIAAIEPHDSPERFEKMGVEVVFGTPRFVSSGALEVESKDSGALRKMKAKRFCIATGSSPFVPPVEGLRETGFVTNETLFRLETLPARLIVLGGGAIGAEMAQAFRRLGARVTVVEQGERLLSKEDREISAFAEEIFRREGIEILTGSKAVAARTNAAGEKIVTIETGGAKREIAGDELLVALGRRPNVEGLELEKAGVRFDEKRIETDAYLRTTAKNIFAAGDVTNRFQFTHTADYEAQVVLRNCFLFYPLTVKADYRVVPWATFTEPEIGRVGLTESEARAKYGSISVVRAEFGDNDRAHAEGETEGFAKIVLAGKKIVGAHIAGPRAGELIHEFVLAMKFGLSLDDLGRAIHVYPTLSKIAPALATEKTLAALGSPSVKKWFGRYLKFWR